METYFIRSRGKLAGPFAMDALQQLVKRGKVSRFDQVSSDKASWRSAGEMAELFTPIAARSASPPAGGGVSAYPGSDADSVYSNGNANAGFGSASASFFYAQNGAAVGPLPLAVLQTLATNGTLRADDPVWVEGSDIATAARQVPMLASFFSGRRSGIGGGEAFSQNNNLPASVQVTQFYAKVVYLIVASLTLVFTVLPISIINGRAQWWWAADSWTVGGSIYSILAAITLLIVAPLAAGLARPVVALALIGVPILFSLVIAIARTLDQGGGGTVVLGIVAMWGAIVFPVLLAAMSRLRARLVDGGLMGARAVNIVLGALLALASLAGVVVLCIAADNWVQRPNATTVTAYSCTWAGVLANLAAGVLAIISGKPRYNQGLSRGTLACMIGAAAMFILAGAVSIAAFGRGIDDGYLGALSYILLRVLVLTAATVLWLSASFQELLTWAFRREAAE